MSEDKNLNGVQDSEEMTFEVGQDAVEHLAQVMQAEQEFETGEANGHASAGEAEEIKSESETEVAPADSVDDEELTSEDVPEAVVSLSLQFGEKTVGLEVTDNFHVDFPALCNELDARPDAFDVDGEIPHSVFVTLTKACK